MSDSHVLDAILPEEGSTFHTNPHFIGGPTGGNYGETVDHPESYWNM
eukprot:CAMPEP_0181307604 /NCGR_PEP_ID=MMETSP1101-20121128/10980_1 /TAXON_ID=46948 /ORGANISM="Rhodomonas abbreviata, Strain Caron Lab Isolate" /LENGTH=46 /DNA_ID= /DNA_START= /DNA_END= /DNA_ORIENTATION=